MWTLDYVNCRVKTASESPEVQPREQSTGTSRSMNENRHNVWREFLLRTFWHGGSTFDAWLNIACLKITGRILAQPNATAQLGLPSAIVIQLLHLAIGLWSSCMISVLYLRHRKNRQGSQDNTTQLHEVIGGILGPRWGAVSLFLNAGTLFTIASLQFVACSNMIHVLNDKLDKRTWVLILGAILFPSIFTPTAQNYRVFSFVGVVTTICTSTYLSLASLLQGKVANVKYAATSSHTAYFSSIAGSAFLAHMFFPVEFMDAMRNPQEFPVASAYGTLYSLVASMTPILCVYITFGDRTLHSLNAFELLPASTFREAAIVLMLIHQTIVFGLYSVGVYTTCEKLLGVYGTLSYAKRTLFRIPVFLAVWLAALAFPFFGRINAVTDSTLFLWNLHLLPCAAYIAAFWSQSSRRLHSPFSRLGWSTDFGINLGIILWGVVVDSALGASSSIAMFSKGGARARLFARCYGCNN